nr:hypothetical transcript [Hymenolepis microstoma]
MLSGFGSLIFSGGVRVSAFSSSVLRARNLRAIIRSPLANKSNAMVSTLISQNELFNLTSYTCCSVSTHALEDNSS